MKANLLSRGRVSRRQRGFSLVELMVANLVGLLVALALLASLLTIGRQFSIVGSGVAAQGSAQIALAALDSAAGTAGSGLYANGRMVCPTWNAWNGSAVVANGVAMMPARIIGGASNSVSDTLVFTGLSGTGRMPALAVMAPTLGANIKLSQGGDLALNDIALLGVPGSGVPCTLFQVTTAPAASPSGCDGNATSCNIVVRAANQGINPSPTTFSSEPTYGFASSGSTVGPAVVMRIGAAGAGFRQDAFTVQCNSLVRFDAFANPSVPGCTSSPLGFGAGVDAIATGVVLMQAQYGVSDSAESDVVTAWVEPSGGTWGATPSAADVARIKALRVVLVTRSRQPDSSQVTAPCTNAAGVANTGPCSFQDAAAPVIDLSGTSVAAGKTWRHYRYRVLKAVIPLRNVIWSDA